MSEEFFPIKTADVKAIVKDLYGIDCALTELDGELDSNYRLETENGSFIFKVSRPKTKKEYLEYQNDLLKFISAKESNLAVPKVISGKDNKEIHTINDSFGNDRFVRLLTWVEGRIFSTVNPKSEDLLYSLGYYAGKITNALSEFDHPYAHRDFEWDIAKAEWVKKFIHLFDKEQKSIIEYFLELFENQKSIHNSLRRSVIHNDVNDNNILVSDDLITPIVIGLIDFGDSIYTQTINDLAICIAYGIMGKPDPIDASIKILKGYNECFPLKEDEIKLLYSLIAIRLVISVTKAAINREKEPENQYLLISEKPAWDLLKQWINLNKDFVYYSFRSACGLDLISKESDFIRWAERKKVSIKELFPTLDFHSIKSVDLSVSSTFLGNESDYNNNDHFLLKLKKLELDNPGSLIAGGYLEIRPLYITDAYRREGNNGPEYRCIHLGVDFWVEANTPLHSLFNGKVVSVNDNRNDKDYGPTVILKHEINDDLTFYTLYGHLSKNSLNILKTGQDIVKGDLVGYIGNSSENGNWAPHLHFQIMLDMLEYEKDYPGVAYLNEKEVWRSICPDPNLLFDTIELRSAKTKTNSDITKERGKLLGRSLSISYNRPLHIVRGSGQYLFDNNGRKYLDTVNNVAHVGHEHSHVVKAGQEQMAVLNTNTRYLHQNINNFAKLLLEYFPDKLSVVHFVNSGSEANELALRMARTHTNQNDIIAIEVGYHGNTSACIDVSSYKFEGKGGKGAPEHTHIVPLPDSFRGIYCGEGKGKLYAEHISEQIANIKSKGRNVAGFICESIISCGGQIELPKDYLQLAYDIVRKEGGICIADEVQVGLGRVGSKFWGFELYDVIPDIVTIGKPLGNGHPVAAVVCTKEIADTFNNGMEYFNTFGGNPVSCAIGKKVLEVIKEEELQHNALKAGHYLKSGLKKLHELFPIIGDVRGQGLFLGFELVDINKYPETEKANYLINRMRELGILMSTDGKDNNVIKIKPPLVFNKENADELMARLKQVLSEDFMEGNAK